MRVQVLFFGATADVVGQREIEIQLEERSTSTEVLANFVRAFPRLKDQKLLVSVNLSHVVGEQVLQDGDELAIFTAVSGG